MRKLTLSLLISGYALFSLHAQVKTPAPSPQSTITQEFGLAKMDIEYARPSAKGRKIFGDLVPFGEMWRTGANRSTRFTFSDKVKVNGIELAAGSYAFYTIPKAEEWTLIFYKNTNFWGVPGKDFSEAEVAAQFTVKPTTGTFLETFTISVGNLRNSGADVEVAWENTRVVFSVNTDTDSKVMADIKAQMEGPSASTYYQAARYYFEEKKDLNIALGWIQLALDKGGEKYWIVRTKALIQADLGRYQDAIATAERSSEIARAENNSDYPRMNDKSIAEWKKKKK
jgi:hypothetical protein